MAAISGVNGKVTNGAVTIVNMTDWEVNLKAATADVSAFGAAGWGAFLGTIKTWTAKFTGNYDLTDTTGQLVLNAGLGSSFTLFFYTDTVHNWTGTAVLTDIIVKSSAKNVITVEYDAMGNSPLTYS